MSEHDDPDRSHPDAQLAEFEKRLNAKLEVRQAQERKYDRPSGSSLGWRYGSEFLGGVLVGIAFGLVVDVLAGISPWGLVAGSFIGFCAGTLNVVRAVKEINALTERED